MLFNADRNVKDNLIQMYQQDIMQRRQRKDEYSFQEKQNDKIFIEQINKKNEEENVKKAMEKQRRANENMQEYNQFWVKKDEERKNKFSKPADVNINNYAMNNSNINNNNYQNSNYNSNPISNNNPNLRIDFDSKRDHLNPIMNPDYIGIRKIEDIEKNKKAEVQKLYRNMLDAQVSMKPNTNEWNSVNRENTISLLALNKKNQVDDLFNKNPCKFFNLYLFKQSNDYMFHVFILSQMFFYEIL